MPIAKAILATMDDQLTKENALKLLNKVCVDCCMFVTFFKLHSLSTRMGNHQGMLLRHGDNLKFCLGLILF